MAIFLIILLIVLLLLFLLALRCRRGNPGLEALRGWAYAHRGLHGGGIPENSMAAFRQALDHGYGIELDIHLLKDGTLAVMHDSALQRTTGQPGQMEDLTAEDLPRYHLEGTEETIPLFQDVLELYQGKAPLIIELKPQGGNHGALAQAACQMMEGYQGAYCMESFDPRCVAWLRKNRPELVRGQLSEHFRPGSVPLPGWLRFVQTHYLSNFLGVPDFVAYKFADRKDTISCWICRHLWGAQGVSWTLKSQQEYDQAVKEGWIPIFEGFRP